MAQIRVTVVNLQSILPQEISSEIFFLVASLVRKSFKIEMVEILSDLKTAHPLLKFTSFLTSFLGFEASLGARKAWHQFGPKIILKSNVVRHRFLQSTIIRCLWAGKTLTRAARSYEKNSPKGCFANIFGHFLPLLIGRKKSFWCAICIYLRNTKWRELTKQIGSN